MLTVLYICAAVVAFTLFCVLAVSYVASRIMGALSNLRNV